MIGRLVFDANKAEGLWADNGAARSGFDGAGFGIPSFGRRIRFMVLLALA
jgi:hypothetical protein